jgi:hypothetical protein
MITADQAKAVAVCMRYLTDCEPWRVAVIDGVQVVFCPVEPLLTTIQAELRLIEQIGEDVAVTRAEPGGA